MQIDTACPTCPSCGSADLKVVPVIHHMLCSYVGPEYDFHADGRGYRCPKCERWLLKMARDWEIVSTSAQCRSCGAEYVVTETPIHCAAPEIVAKSPHDDTLRSRRRSDHRNETPRSPRASSG